MPEDTPEIIPPAVGAAGKTKVFISWSGDISRRAAHALRSWLRLVVHAVEPYMSAEDIAVGNRWGSNIARALDASDFGIICVTPQNIDSRWLNYEAGAIGKRFTTTAVCPLLIGVDKPDLGFPLALYQAAECTQPDIRKLIDSLNRACGPAAVPAEVIDQTFPLLWPKLDEKLAPLVLKRNTSPICNDCFGQRR